MKKIHFLTMLITMVMAMVAIPAWADWGSENVTMSVGETKTLYLPSSVTSKTLKSVTFYSASYQYVEVLSYTNYSVNVKALKAISTPVIVRCDYYYYINNGGYTYQASGAYDFNVTVVGETIVKPENVDIPNYLQVSVGESKQVPVTVAPPNATYTLTYKITDTSIATVSSNGIVTGKCAGATDLKVMTDNGKYDMCRVTVSEKKPTSIDIPSSVSLEVGKTKTLTPTVVPSDATYTLSWSSSNTSVATVSQSGVVTAKATGATIITVRTDNGKSDDCLVTVTQSAVSPTSVSVTPTSLSLEVNQTANLTATVYPSNATTSLTWSSSNTNVAKVSSGKVTAVGAGSCVVTVKTSNGKSATCNVTVAEPMVNPTSVYVSPSSLSLEVNETANLTATVYPSNATTTLTWNSSNNNVAKVSNGKVTAVSAGNCKITVKTSNGKTAYCDVTVKQSEVLPTSVSVSPSSLSLEVNQTGNLTATIYPSNATTTLTWSTSNSSVAKVSNGKVTAMGAGTCYITVNTSNGKSASCNVTVKNSGSSTSGDWSGTYSVTSSVERKHVSDYNFPSNFTLEIQQVNGTYYVTEMLGLDLTHSIYNGIKVNMIDNQRAELDLDDNNDLGGYTTTGSYLDGLYLISTNATYQWSNLGHLYLTRISDGSIVMDDFNVFAFGSFTGYDSVLDAVYHNIKASDTSSVPTILEDSEQFYLLEIYDLQGNRLFSGQEENKPCLPSGIYILRRGNNVQKIMVH